MTVDVRRVYRSALPSPVMWQFIAVRPDIHTVPQLLTCKDSCFQVTQWMRWCLIWPSLKGACSSLFLEGNPELSVRPGEFKPLKIRVGLVAMETVIILPSNKRDIPCCQVGWMTAAKTYSTSLMKAEQKCKPYVGGRTWEESLQKLG